MGPSMTTRRGVDRAGSGRLWRLGAAVSLGCTLLLPAVASGQADEARARKIVAGVCFLCHGMEGESTSELFPRLAGQHGEYIAKQLANFKSGKRKSTAMADMVAKLSPDDMASLGRYFEKMVVPREAAKEPDLAGVGKYIYHNGNRFSGVPACAGCHGPAGAGLPGQYPRLAGQYAEYIATQLKAFKEGGRANDANGTMRGVAARLTEREIRAVSEYAAGLR